MFCEFPRSVVWCVVNFRKFSAILTSNISCFFSFPSFCYSQYTYVIRFVIVLQFWTFCFSFFQFFSSLSSSVWDVSVDISSSSPVLLPCLVYWWFSSKASFLLLPFKPSAPWFYTDSSEQASQFRLSSPGTELEL